VNQLVDSDDTPSHLAIQPGSSNAVVDQKFDLLVTLSEPVKLFQMFLPKLTKLDTASLVGNFDSKEKLLSLNVLVPQVQYDSINIDTVRVTVSGNKTDLTLAGGADNIEYKGKTNISGAKINARMFEQSMDAGL